MSRISRNNEYQYRFAQRLRQLLDTHLQLGVKELATRLSLLSTSTLRKALSGNGGMDIERLQILGQIKGKDGLYPNLDWLLTGRGLPTIPLQSEIQSDEWQVWLSVERKQALKVLSASSVPESAP